MTTGHGDNSKTQGQLQSGAKQEESPSVQELYTAAVAAAMHAGSRSSEADVCAMLAQQICWSLDHGADVITRNEVVAMLRGYARGCGGEVSNA